MYGIVSFKILCGGWVERQREREREREEERGGESKEIKSSEKELPD